MEVSCRYMLQSLNLTSGLCCYSVTLIFSIDSKIYVKQLTGNEGEIPLFLLYLKQSHRNPAV